MVSTKQKSCTSICSVYVIRNEFFKTCIISKKSIYLLARFSGQEIKRVAQKFANYLRKSWEKWANYVPHGREMQLTADYLLGEKVSLFDPSCKYSKPSINMFFSFLFKRITARGLWYGQTASYTEEDWRLSMHLTITW